MLQIAFFLSTSSTLAPLELVHSDLWDPASITSTNSFRYYVVFIDDFTRFLWIYFLHSKDELVPTFTRFKTQVKNLLNSTIKTLRTDNGTEFTPLSQLFPQISHQRSCPYTLQ